MNPTVLDLIARNYLRSNVRVESIFKCQMDDHVAVAPGAPDI